MVEQGRTILALGCGSVLVKGGHSASADSVDLLVTAHGVRRYSAARVASENTHGTGCSLSAAIAAGLVRGQSLADAIEAAKVWLTGAIAAAKEQRLGSGHGPVAHFHDLTYPANRRPL